MLLSFFIIPFSLSQDTRDNIEKVLVLQGLLKKEHRKTVNVFEECAFVSVVFSLELIGWSVDCFGVLDIMISHHDSNKSSFHQQEYPSVSSWM